MTDWKQEFRVMNSIYIVDSSAWINLSQNYPKDVFSGLWASIENLIKNQRIISPKEVYKEIERRDDELAIWSKKHRKMF